MVASASQWGVRIGEVNSLTTVRKSPHGFYLTDGQIDVLLPTRLSPRHLMVGDPIDVFVTTDSEDRPIATTQRPKAKVGEFALMRVVQVNTFGAFVDWGLDKDLLCPVGQQRKRLKEGEEQIFRVYLDEETQRVAASTKLGSFLSLDGRGLETGKKVQILVAESRRDQATVIINSTYLGTIFLDELIERLHPGERRDAYIKKIREEDGAIAVSLRPQGYTGALTVKDVILKDLERNGGFVPITDRSRPEEIQRRYGLSKGAFKKLVGTLYKEGIIDLEFHGIRLRKRS